MSHTDCKDDKQNSSSSCARNPITTILVEQDQSHLDDELLFFALLRLARRFCCLPISHLAAPNLNCTFTFYSPYVHVSHVVALNRVWMLFLNTYANIFRNLSTFPPLDFLTNDVTLMSASNHGGFDVSFLKDAGNTLQMVALAWRFDTSPICSYTRFIRICLFMCARVCVRGGSVQSLPPAVKPKGIEQRGKGREKRLYE